ncbi:replication factor C subunit 1 [Malaya genurostris]|uniref:replication factor C subunit 1 n=1 Tax=Malaya genurostris TaxID=325434 RepID=UPI0026F3880C|nr:replication factor C subunit 1 [Malaya genurostris]XP_058450933.1 replication factor C subunit 1 [Malaya genurostris]
MSKDIRSFFNVGVKVKKPETPKQNSAQAASKRKAVVYSDEEQPEKDRKQSEIQEKPISQNKKRRVIDSDDEEKSPVRQKKSSSSSLTSGSSKLKPVSAADVFSSAPVKRTEVPRPTKKAIKEEIEIHSDEELEKTLIGIDDSGMVAGTPTPTKKKEKNSPTVKEERKTNGHGNHKESKSSPKKKREDIEKYTPEKKDENRKKHTPEKKDENRKKHTPEKKDENRKKHTPEKRSEEQIKTHNSEKKKEKPIVSKESSSEEGTTPKSYKKNHNESVISDEERHERKRMSAMLYQKFKNRSGPANPGSKEIPKGKPDCLAGLQFVVTGVLESLERDECAQIIKDFGGKVVSSVTKKVTHMVIGEEAGPSKLAKAEELGIPQLSEDALLNLIRERSGLSTNGSSKETTAAKILIKEEKTPSKEKEKKRKKTAEHSPSKRTPDKKISEAKSSLPKIPKIEKKSPEKPMIPKIESRSPVKKQEIVSPTKRKESSYEKDIHSTENMAWVDKYKPTSVKQIIGQTGASSNVQKLINWLSKWHSNHDGKKKIPRPNPWAKNDDGSYYRAALLSGPPGVGKTTTATLVCKELGFDTVEFNASDTRSKKLLKEEVSELLNNKSLFGYFTDGGKGDKVSNRHVLLMDEVDGMAGNEDRGGIQELISLIKESHVPIICMCNDRNHQKMRSLVNYCYDLKFSKPRVEQIKGAMMSVCFKEGLKLAPGALEEIIAGTGGDVRQTLNHLAMYSAGNTSGLSLSVDKAKQGAESARKDVKMGPWDVIRKVFSAEDHKSMSIHDKSDLFFHDYSLAPLFVQENYLKVTPKVPKTQVMDQIALTADSLSRGDMVDRRIRSNMAWSLLPLQAMYSSVLPGEYMEGFFSAQINFPGWLGKNSKATKRKRLAQEIHDHTRTCTSGSRLSVRMDYAPFLVDAIVRPLKEKGSEGVDESLSVIKDYHLLREDIESLIELTSWPKKKSPMDSVDGKVKAALTRAYNKEIAPYSYSVVNAVKKKRAEAVDEAAAEMYGEDDDAYNGAADSEEEKDDDDLENNAFIKVKKKPATKGAVASSTKAGGSKTKTTTSAKGKKK